jgi:transient receptor potential cation channel subfamily C
MLGQARNYEKALERHDIVCRLLVRRFVTSEQRKRDDFGITEDDIMEVRQDISTLRFELVNILKTNGMNTPDLDKSDRKSKLHFFAIVIFFCVIN